MKALTPDPTRSSCGDQKSLASYEQEEAPVGVRIPDHVITQAIVEALGEPWPARRSSLPGEEEHAADPVVDDRWAPVDLVIGGSPWASPRPTTVIDSLAGTLSSRAALATSRSSTDRGV